MTSTQGTQCMGTLHWSHESHTWHTFSGRNSDYDNAHGRFRVWLKDVRLPGLGHDTIGHVGREAWGSGSSLDVHGVPRGGRSQAGEKQISTALGLRSLYIPTIHGRSGAAAIQLSYPVWIGLILSQPSQPPRHYLLRSWLCVHDGTPRACLVALFVRRQMLEQSLEGSDDFRTRWWLRQIWTNQFFICQGVCIIWIDAHLSVIFLLNKLKEVRERIFQ